MFSENVHFVYNTTRQHNTYGQALGPQWLAQRFTLHSFRGGAAVSLAVAEFLLHEIMDHIGWKTSKQAMHYIRVKAVLNSAGAAAKLANLSAASTDQFLVFGLEWASGFHSGFCSF